MKIDLPRFNLKDVAINPETVLTFPKGLVGFEDKQRFSIFHEDGKPTVFWLQSLDDPQLSFSIVPPDAIDIAYEIELSDEDNALLQLARPEDALVVVILYRDAAGADGKQPIAASTRSPLVINLERRLGMQKILREARPTVVMHGR